MTMLIPQGAATFSGCGRYRYRLSRDLGATTNASCCFIMLNPSTADGTNDDPTIRRCKGFASGWGYRHLLIVNLFAFRATDPRQMWMMHDSGVDIVGPENDIHIVEAVGSALEVFCAWGTGKDKKTKAIISARAQHVYRLVNRVVWCLGTNQDGSPKHPLYQPEDAQALVWSAYHDTTKATAP